MKILMVISDTNVGGAGKWISECYKYIDRNRFQVKAVIPTSSKLKAVYAAVDLPVIECDGIADVSFSRSGISNLYRIFRKEQPDIVHCHGAMSARVAGSLPGSKVKKVVYTRHSVFEPQGFFTTPIGKGINKLLTRFTSDKVLAVCNAAKKNLTDTGVTAKSVSVVYNGVEALPIPTPEERQACRKQYGLSDGEIAFSISARLNPVKGHKYLVEAVHQMKETDHVKFFIAGTGQEEQNLKALVHQYHLEDKIIFTGFLSDMSSLLYATDVLLNCSYGTEACSLAILEAFSLGIPCIATDYGGNPELVSDGINGIVYPTNDTAALKNAIETIRENPHLIAEYGAQAKELFEQKFTVKIMAKNIEKVYEDLIHE